MAGADGLRMGIFALAADVEKRTRRVGKDTLIEISINRRVIKDLNFSPATIYRL